MGELHTLLDHGLLEIVNLHLAKVMGLNGNLQGRRSFRHGFIGG